MFTVLKTTFSKNQPKELFYRDYKKIQFISLNLCEIAIMRRSDLEKVHHKNKSEKSFKAYKKQKNFCSRLYKKERKRFFNNLNPSFVTDNKLFWKTIKPFFSNKGNYGSQIKLVEKDEVLQDDDLIAKELNKFFKNACVYIKYQRKQFHQQ